MWRAVVDFKNGSKPLSKNCDSKDDAYTWILEYVEKGNVKTSMIANKDNLKDREIEHF